MVFSVYVKGCTLGRKTSKYIDRGEVQDQHKYILKR